MLKSKKTFLGLLGLVFVALMTAFAYCLPAIGAYAESMGADSLKVTVYDPDNPPSTTINSPEMDDIFVTSIIDVSFDYENISAIDFIVEYEEEAEDGSIVLRTATVGHFEPDPADLDPELHVATGTGTKTIDLSTFNLDYNVYTLRTIPSNPASSYPEQGDMTEFYFIPAEPEQKDNEEGTNNPIVDVLYDEDVARIEIMVVDDEGNELFDEPVVIEIPEPYDGGTIPVTLPFASNGIESGDYTIVVTSYRIEVNEQGEEEYIVAPTPLSRFDISYTRPAAPDVPNTGRFLGGINSVKTDYMITSVIAFAGIAIIALVLISRKKKEHSKNTRSRK